MEHHQVMSGVSEELIRNHIRCLEGIRHPQAAPAALEAAGLYVRDSLASFDYQMREQIFIDQGRSFPNFIATRSGTGQPEKRVLVVAHFDTVATSPGADDNASGVAVLLELARVLNRCRFERTVQLVGVNLEENAVVDDIRSALRGSRALAGLAREEGWEIEGVVVLESVGFAGEEVLQRAPAGVPFPVPEKGNFIAVVGNQGSAPLVQAFARGIERHRIALPYLPLVVPGNGELLPDTRRSDHAPFWDLGFPAIMLTDTSNFRSPHYHQPSDTLETVNVAFAAGVCRATAALVLELAGGSVLTGRP